jgi:hypothetical protein
MHEYKQATSRPSSPIVNDGLTVWITGHRGAKIPMIAGQKRCARCARGADSPEKKPRRLEAMRGFFK